MVTFMDNLKNAPAPAPHLLQRGDLNTRAHSAITLTDWEARKIRDNLPTVTIWKKQFYIIKWELATGIVL